MLLKLAWRNIWRNKRRTLITMASIVFAVILCVLMDALKKGFLDEMKKKHGWVLYRLCTSPTSGLLGRKNLGQQFSFSG